MQSSSPSQFPENNAARQDDQREEWVKPELTVHSIVETTLSANANFANSDAVNNYS
jgi:hypothetical protein